MDIQEFPSFEPLEYEYEAGDAVPASIAELKIKINALGAELLSLTQEQKPIKTRNNIMLRMFPYAAPRVREYLTHEVLPLPDNLVIAGSLDSALLHNCREPRRPFFELFESEIPEAADRLKRRGIFVDRNICEYLGMDLRQQALASAVIESAMYLEKEDRRIVYEKIALGNSNLQIAAKLEISRKRVDALLRKVLADASPNVKDWEKRLLSFGTLWNPSPNGDEGDE